MERYKDNPIWQAIISVEKNEIKNPMVRYEEVKKEFDKVNSKINLQSQRAMDNLEIFLSAFGKGQEQAAKRQLDSAKRVFKSDIVPHYQREEEGEKKKMAAQGRSNSQQCERKREDVDAVAKRFRHIFDTDLWPDAHEELDRQKDLTEKKTAELLMEIVESAFKFCKDEAERQILGAELVIEDIVQNGEIPKTEKSQPSNKQASSPHDLLRHYRYLNAHLSESRLIKKFLDGHMKNFCKKNALKRDGAIEKYAIACIQTTWLLCTEDPPVYMVIGKGGDDFDDHLYTKITRKGKKIDYVVWPALKYYENGPVLSQGAAQCK